MSTDNPGSSKFERFLAQTKFQLARSQILGKLLFRTARLENERKKILQKIAQYYCDQFAKEKDTFQAPPELAALFSRQFDLANQIRAHYDEISHQPEVPPDQPLGSDTTEE